MSDPQYRPVEPLLIEDKGFGISPRRPTRGKPWVGESTATLMPVNIAALGKNELFGDEKIHLFNLNGLQQSQPPTSAEVEASRPSRQEIFADHISQ